MKIEPALRALRGDPAAQRKAQDALESAREDWRARPETAAVLTELALWDLGKCFGDCPALEALMGEAGAAQALVDALVAAQLTGLAAHPLGQSPFRHQVAGGIAICQLAVAGGASLSLLVYEQTPDTGQEQALTFADGERHEIVLAGAGEAEIVTCRDGPGGTARLDRMARFLRRGDRLTLSGANTAKRLTSIAGRLVVLRLARTPRRPALTRQVSLASGEVLHRASGDRRESRHELALAVLGRMKRREAAGEIAALAQQPGGDHVRWQALREALALDTAAGFAALSAVARKTADPLASPAGALRAQLVERHPALAALDEDTPCPAC